MGVAPGLRRQLRRQLAEGSLLRARCGPQLANGTAEEGRRRGAEGPLWRGARGGHNSVEVRCGGRGATVVPWQQRQRKEGDRRSATVPAGQKEGCSDQVSEFFWSATVELAATI